MGVGVPSTWAILLCFSRYISRSEVEQLKFEPKHLWDVSGKGLTHYTTAQTPSGIFSTERKSQEFSNVSAEQDSLANFHSGDRVRRLS